VGIVKSGRVFPVLAGTMDNVVGWMLSGLLEGVAIHGLTC